MRRALENLFALLLGHAAQHAESLALGLELAEVRQPVKHLLFRLVPDGTGVIEDQIGLFHRFHPAITLLHQRAHHFFRVVDIHLAPEGLDVERLARFRLHPAASITPSAGPPRRPRIPGSASGVSLPTRLDRSKFRLSSYNSRLTPGPFRLTIGHSFGFPLRLGKYSASHRLTRGRKEVQSPWRCKVSTTY